jgi:hypothetical protein
MQDDKQNIKTKTKNTYNRNVIEYRSSHIFTVNWNPAQEAEI